MLIDVAITGDRNVIKKEAEKILQYEELKIEVQCMWNVKTKSDTGNNGGGWNRFKIIHTISEQHTGKRLIKELQTTAILCTAHLLREVLM